MDRCALFVDAGYVLADGAMAVHGTRRRESVSWDYAGLLHLLGSMAMERSRLPLLRCYWYEATVEGRRSADHDALADLPGVKLRLAKMRPGRREGVESEIHRDLTTLARNKAVSDAMVVSAEEDLAGVISDVQDMGMRVTLLNIVIDGEWTISRTLRQECDDIVEIGSAHLRPYVELITGAEPSRGDERDGTLIALRPNGNGLSAGRSAGYPQPSARQSPVQQSPVQQSPVQQPSAPGYGGLNAADYPGSAPLPHSLPDDQGRSGVGIPGDMPAPQEPGAQDQAAIQEQQPTARANGRGSQEPGLAEGPDAEAQPAVAPGEYGGAGEYGSGVEYASVPDFMPVAYEPGAAAAEPAPARQEQLGYRQGGLPAPGDRAAALDPQQAMQDYAAGPGGAQGDMGARAEPPQRPELVPREDLYPAPVAVPGPAEDLPGDHPQARSRQGSDLSGYNPGGVREQFQPEMTGREPNAADGDRYQPVPVAVPAGSAQIRRLPSRGGGQPLSAPGQGQPGQPIAPQLPPAPVAGPMGSGAPVPGMAPNGVPGAAAEPVAGPPSGGQPIAPVVPMDQGGVGYPGGRSGSYPGPPPTAGMPGTTAMDPPMAMPGQPSLPPASLPSGAQPPPGPMGQGGMPGPADAGAGQPGRHGSGPQPALGPPSPVSPAGYPGGQATVSLGDAVQSAHEEGQEFGESVAREAPALWLEAVLARKPRMPSDLEARLLQGSALPIDFLLHDEVRHALRRGFWDALERARR